MKLLFLVLSFFIGSIALKGQTRNLNYFLEQAKTNSPLINKNKNAIKIVALDLKQVKSVLSKPKVSIEGYVLFAPIVSHNNGSNRFEWVSEGATDYTGYDLASTDGGQYQAGISIRQPLLNASVFRAYSDKASISEEIDNNTIALTVHELEQLVGYQYILCLKAKIQTQNFLSLINQIDEQSLVMQKLVENALYKQTDLMLLQIEHSNYESNYLASQAEYKSSLYDLNLICGISDSTIVDIQDNYLELSPEISMNSKFLTTYKLDSLSLLADQSIYRQNYKPQLSWFTSAGLNAIYLPDFNRLGFNTGLTFSWTIYDGNLRSIEQQKTAVNLNSLEFEKQKFIKETYVQILKILNQIRSLEERETVAREQITQYELLLNAYKEKLRLSEISVMDLKILFRDMSIKKQELLLLEMEKQTLINAYNYWNY